MIVPFAAGGPTDVDRPHRRRAHVAARSGSRSWSRTSPAPAAPRASPAARRPQPDGYTIMMGHMGTHGAAPALYPNLKYDPAKDFAPIGAGRRHADRDRRQEGFPGQRPEGFVDYVKANGDKVNMAHAGVGSVSHTTGICFNSVIKAKPTMVAYRGTGPALNDLDRRTRSTS